MDHAYMAALMHGEISFKAKPKAETKIQLYKDMDKQIETYIDHMQFEEDYIINGLLSSRSKREKLKFEMKEAAKLSKLSAQMEAALAFLASDASQYLSSEAFQRLKSDFTEASSKLSDLKIENFMDSDLQNLAAISNETMQSIAEIAIAKFSEEKFADCLSLFVLLSNLNPNNPDYWLRQGIAAQKCNDLELASNSYDAAAELEPDSIGPVLLAAECYIKRNLLDEAKTKLKAAKEIAAKNEVDTSWLDLIPTLDELLQQ